MKGAFHVLVIGGGATGAALAHDLTLRDLRVTLVERWEVTAGTTGRHHGLLHSGARYVLTDPDSARECIEENWILRRIAPDAFELNDGLFVALTDEDVTYLDPFLEGCARCGIPTRVLSREHTLRLEPNLNPTLKLAVQVPDGTMDAMRLPLRFLATAQHHGAEIRPFTEVVDIHFQGRTVAGARVRDHRTEREYTIAADVVINATGPWAGQIAQMAGVDVPIRPSPGVLVAVEGRLCNMVINRLHPAGDGDIIVPQRRLSIVGTSSWVVEDPDDLDVPEAHVRMMIDLGALLIPTLREMPVRAAWAAARPLVGPRTAHSGRELSRTFKCFDHADEGVEGLVTIIGGKASTARAMAEVTTDIVCAKLGITAPCRTREVVLLPHTAYYAG